MGAPDMAFEVVSKTSRQKDEVDLVATYAAAGVEEYWLAEDQDGLPVLRIQVLRDAAYVEVPPSPDGWVASPLWRHAFRIVGFTNGAGQPDARLELRPV